jgi:tetratricopeptide (TPR) repeat protein
MTRRKRTAFLPAALLLLAPALPPGLSADVLVLKDGKTVAGEVKEQGDAYEVITKYGTLNVQKSEVSRVVRPAALVADAEILRRTAGALMEEGQKAEARPEEREAKRTAAEETLKKALALYQEARSVSASEAAADLDKAIAGVTKDIALCREKAGPAPPARPAEPARPADPAVLLPPAAPLKPGPAVAVPAKPAPPPAAKAPEPDAASQKEAEAKIREILKADYAKRAPADLQALAGKLIRMGMETRDDPAARYVLLREGRDLAAQGGDTATALKAIDQMEKSYEVDALGMKTAALATAGRAARTPEAALQVAHAYLALMEEAEAADQYDAAAALAGKAESAARQGQDASLVAEAQAQRKEAESMRNEYQAVKESVKELQSKPDDPAACLSVGRFLCLVKGDWEKGLPLLARGSDAALQALAEKELGDTAKTEAMTALGDGWWEAGAGKSGATKARMQARALHWYEKALPQAAGLTKARITSRLEAAARAEGGDNAPAAGLVFWVEPGLSPGAPFRDLRSGIPGENKGCATAPSGGTTAIAHGSGKMIVYPVTAPVGAVTRNGSIFVWLKTDAVEQFGCLVNRCENRAEGPEDFGLYVRGGHLNVYFNWTPPDVAPVGSSTAALPAGKWTFGGITWDEEKLTFYLDGKKDNAIPLKKGTPLPRGSKVVLGVSVPGGPGGIEYYTGLLGSVMIFNRELAEPEIQRLHATTARRFR